MRRWTTVFLALVLTVLTASPDASQEMTDDQRALRSRIEERYDVVPLTGGIALRPKTRVRDVRWIEISEGVIAINGTPATGQELRERVGGDADGILRLSYLSAEQRRELFGGPGARAAPRRDGRSAADEQPATSGRIRRSGGDRVRIFGDVSVDENEEIAGDVVAVIGSVRVNGEARQVVAVLGSVDLGPKAVIHSDVVSVGGRVRRAPGAEVRGGVTEISVGGVAGNWNIGPWVGPGWRDGFDAVPRLLISTFRWLLLVLFAGIAFVIARGTVEGSAQRVSDNPAKAFLVGLAAELMFAPVFALTAIVLAITIVGIPLLILLPFGVIVLLLMALAGFTGTAGAIGQATRRRFGMSGESGEPGFLDVVAGVLVIVSPLLLGRFLAIGGWPAEPLVWVLVVAGTVFEFAAWTTGFGAVLMNTFSRWRARRVARTAAPVAPA